MSDLSESAIRRAAAKKGYRIKKSRVRNTENPSYGSYMLIDRELNFAVLGGDAYGVSLEEIESYLEQDSPDLASAPRVNSSRTDGDDPTLIEQVAV